MSSKGWPAVARPARGDTIQPGTKKKEHMRTKVVAALVLAPLTALAITACGSAESGGDSAPAERITVTATPTPEPEPVDPDEAFLEATRARPAFAGHMQTAAAHLTEFGSAADLAGGASAARKAVADYSWLEEHMDGEQTSADSPLAQTTMAAFRVCRDAFTSAADAIEEVDPAAMDDAGTDIQTCIRELESVTSRF